MEIVHRDMTVGVIHGFSGLWKQRQSPPGCFGCPLGKVYDSGWKIHLMFLRARFSRHFMIDGVPDLESMHSPPELSVWWAYVIR